MCLQYCLYVGTLRAGIGFFSTYKCDSPLYAYSLTESIHVVGAPWPTTANPDSAKNVSGSLSHNFGAGLVLYEERSRSERAGHSDRLYN